MKTTKTNARRALPKNVAEMHVLVVDDDDFQCEVMQETLTSMGVGLVTIATSGPDALLKLTMESGTTIDLMVCDLHMPHMDGFEFMGAAAQAGFQGALIIASGQSEDIRRSAELVAQLKRFRVLGAVAKPVHKNDLTRLIRMSLAA
ncbi:MAG: response regulator [Curvibacter sp.]|nr:MAG: response regulator [Curvibacter sp.]